MSFKTFFVSFYLLRLHFFSGLNDSPWLPKVNINWKKDFWDLLISSIYALETLVSPAIMLFDNFLCIFSFFYKSQHSLKRKKLSRRTSELKENASIHLKKEESMLLKEVQKGTCVDTCVVIITFWMLGFLLESPKDTR